MKNYQVKYVTTKKTRAGKPMQVLTLAEITDDGEILKPVRAFNFNEVINFNRTKVYQFALGLTSKGQNIITDIMPAKKAA